MNALDDILKRLNTLPEGERKEIIEAAEKATAGMMFLPNSGPQTDAYFSPADLLYFGGSAGGGKSMILLGLAVNEHSVSRLFRRQFKDIDGEGGLAPAMARILGSYKGYNQQKHVWAVPNSKRKVEFGAFETEKEAEAYQGRAADFFGFDEAVHFQEHLVRFITSWNRTVIPGQRCRTVLASNPPVTPEGLWIIEWFAPWLDPRHPNPARSGELRWYTQIDGHDVEVDQDYSRIQVDAGGAEIIVRPKSRTFIPASLTDNPDLLESGYASQLGQLPKHLREAFLEGKFRTQLDDADWQVIPTEWILAAQQRWEQRKDQPKGPMTAIGLDPAQGGPDETAYQRLYGTFFDEPILKEGVNTKNPREVAAGLFAIMEDDCQVVVDCTGGWGNGPLEHLQNNGVNAHAVIYSMATPQRTRDRKYGFANMRAKMIWRLREALDPDNGDDIALPPGRRVVAELAAPRFKIVNRDQILIEPKEDIKKRIGRSPAILDSIVMAWVEPLDKGMRGEKRRSTQRRNTHKTAHSPTVQTSYATARERYSKR